MAWIGVCSACPWSFFGSRLSIPKSSFGIGIHSGPVIVGEMGYGHASALTAIGDAVNTASRLESLSKDFDCEVIVSAEAARRSRIDLGRFERHQVAVRGRSEPMAVFVVPAGIDLVVRLGQSTTGSTPA